MSKRVDLSSWDLAISFTGREAAYLILGVDPSGPDASKHSVRHIYERMANAFNGAIAQAEFTAFVEPAFPSGPPKESKSGMMEYEALRCVALTERAKHYSEHGDVSALKGWLEHSEISFEKQKFSRMELDRWLKENKMKSAYQFDATISSEVGPISAQDVEPEVEKSLSKRERDTLLTIIAVLCKEAKLDYSKAAKTAGLIQGTAASMQISIGETTIENHLKKIPDALATRIK